MPDYTFPSVFFSYFLFALLLCGAVYFFVRSIKDGYWGSSSEEPKYRMLQDDDHEVQPTSAAAPRRS